MLDSLIDYPEDTKAGQYSLIEPYGPPPTIAAGMQRIATESLRHAQALPAAGQHTLLLSAMTALYLTADEATMQHALPATHHVLHAIGDTATPAMLVLKLRRALSHHGHPD